MAGFKKIGFIGTGVMGGRMSRNLATKIGVPVIAHDLDPDKVLALDNAGVEAAPSVAAVVEAAVVGVPDDNSGEAIKLFVVARNESLDAETLRAWCKKELAGYKVPKLIEFRDELPKTNVGKVLRRQLRDEGSTETGTGTDG